MFTNYLDVWNNICCSVNLFIYIFTLCNPKKCTNYFPKQFTTLRKSKINTIFQCYFMKALNDVKNTRNTDSFDTKFL